MIFTETKLNGAFVIDLEPVKDQRGFFGRAWCRREFEEHGLVPNFVQANISYNRKKGTLRGMHYQTEPFSEDKLVRCIKGAIFDVIIDLRPDCSTYREWFGVELTAKNHKALYVPKEFAHGFLTTEDETEVFYIVSQFYTPTSERGVRWDDPLFKISWPIPVSVVSEKDAAWPDYCLKG
jgi:dTDP-4-dehydrorhamnose 3,5-epimerase